MKVDFEHELPKTLSKYTAMKYNIEVFTTNSCPACESVKQMLNVRQLVYKELNIDNPAVLKELRYRIPGVKSIPQVFINDRYIGGLQELIKEFSSNDYY